MSSSWVKNNLDTVVLDQLHFLCYKTWSEMVKWSRSANALPVTWSNVTSSQEENSCPACMAHSSCMCAVNTQRYMCRCHPGRYQSTRGPCEVCPEECPEGEPECQTSCNVIENIEDGTDDDIDDSTSPDMVIIIAISAATLVLLLVTMVFLLFLTRWRRFKKNKSAGQTFFNFMFFKEIINMRTVIVNEREGSSARVSNPYVIGANQPSGADLVGTRSSDPGERGVPPVSVHQQVQAYEARSPVMDDTINKRRLPTILPASRSSQHYTGCIRDSGVSGHSYATIDPPSSATDANGYLELPVRTYPTGDQHGPPGVSDVAYENIVNSTNEQMIELTRLVETTDMDGIAIFCKADDNLVMAGNLRVRSCDVSNVLRLLESDSPIGAIFPVDGTMYNIRIHHNGNSLYAEEVPGGKESNAIWMINTENYLVMVRGIRAMALSCEQNIARIALALES